MDGRAARRLEALRRVDKFDNYLARNIYLTEMEMQASLPSSEAAPAAAERAGYHPMLFSVGLDADEYCQHSQMSTGGDVRSEATFDDDSSYMNIGCIDPTQVQQHNTEDNRAQSDKRRNRRFQRFVAAKQCQRQRAMLKATALPAALPNIQETAEDAAASITIDHVVSEAIVSPQDEAHSSPSRRLMTRSISPDNSPVSVMIQLPHADNDEAREVDECAVGKEYEENEDTHSSPSRRLMTESISPDNSPVSVVHIPSLQVSNTNEDSVPKMHERATEKQVFHYLRVELNAPQGIMQPKLEGGQGKESKCLTWWDDEVNWDKPFTLKTDESFDDSANDDDSSCWYLDPNVSCHNHIQEYIAEKTKKVRWLDQDDNCLYEVPELDSHPPDEAVEMDDEGVILNGRRRKIMCSLLNYYKGRLEYSFSKALEASRDSLELLDDTIVAIKEEKTMSGILDLFESPEKEDDQSLGDTSESTPVTCNVSCLA